MSVNSQFMDVQGHNIRAWAKQEQWDKDKIFDAYWSWLQWSEVDGYIGSSFCARWVDGNTIWMEFEPTDSMGMYRLLYSFTHLLPIHRSTYDDAYNRAMRGI